MCHCANGHYHDNYIDVKECVEEELHLTCCDDDGYCNYCGNSAEDDEDDNYWGDDGNWMGYDANYKWF